MKAMLLALTASVILYSCSGQKETTPRQLAVKRAYKLLDARRYAEAHSLLDSVITAYPQVADTAYYLRNDLAQIVDSNALGNLALEIDRDNKWQGIESGSYKPKEFWLASSMTWAKEPLLIVRLKVPKLKADGAKSAKAQEALLAKHEEALSAESLREPIEKRIKAAEGLREIYLDGGQDVKVSLTGKNKEVITLSYVLISDVWSHRMHKEGNIDALLELGFKKVILTDGYDYRMVWSRKD
jgi:hypothetical protein